jgi:LAGLIDADG endonuclease
MSSLVENGAGTGWTVYRKLSYYSDIIYNKPYSMREILLFGSKSSSLLSNMIEKYLLTWRQFAWVIYFYIIHQRLYIGHLINKFSNINFISSNTKTNNNNNINKTSLKENKEIFYQWLVGFTDGDGCFSISYQFKNKWTLTFKLSQNTYNLRLLYFIKNKLGVGKLNIEKTNNMANYRIRNRIEIESIIFPIFDKYPLLTTKYFNYIKFKKAFYVLSDTNLSTIEKDKIMKSIVQSKPPIHYISPAWLLVNNNISNFESASKIINKPWLIGFTEAEASFYLVAKSNNRLVHGFEINQKLDKIVLIAIKYILGIKTKVKIIKSGSFSIVTTNSRAVENIIKYYKNTMKGMKSLEYRIWSRSYSKYKGNYLALNNIRNRVRIMKMKKNILDNLIN